ncbi:transcriptional regulator [Dyadobacter sp. CY312]|uniref:transcriptional regulator n=1 Tax=Dyadobacter sp. CY312 TaxID=2907303 RepID=UPI001F43149F|nr:transcriptional regulator [Dyadobacter sp. CY312]MCE7038774.1 transcriptional regulator [Dyadobacter sp. CY312]
MKNRNYEQQAKDIIADMREIIDAKGLNLSEALGDAGISAKEVEQILSGKKLPALNEFLALCEISGITFNLPSVETPKNPM